MIVKLKSREKTIVRGVPLIAEVVVALVPETAEDSLRLSPPTSKLAVVLTSTALVVLAIPT